MFCKENRSCLVLVPRLHSFDFDFIFITILIFLKDATLAMHMIEYRKIHNAIAMIES